MSTPARLLDSNLTAHWIEPSDIASMRQHADNLPWDAQRTLHALLDAWEDHEAGDPDRDEIEEKLSNIEMKLETAKELAEEQHVAARKAYDALDLNLSEDALVVSAREYLDEAFKFEPCSICPAKATDLYDSEPSIDGSARCKAHGRPAPTSEPVSRVVPLGTKRPAKQGRKVSRK